MEAKEWRFRDDDRAKWGAGPWSNEPDKAQWTDAATGLPCLIVRNRLGALCGYVGVATDHPWHGKSYHDEVPQAQQSREPIGREEHVAPLALFGAVLRDHPGMVPIDCAIVVHGGLTYADKCQPGDPTQAICHIPAPGDPDDVWWFGFDCHHYGDTSPGMMLADRERGWATDGVYRPIGYVRDECALLAKQLAAVAR